MRIAHITDPHLSVATPRPYDVDTWAAFEWSVQTAEEAGAAFLALGGDICFRDPEPDVYERVADRLRSFSGEWGLVPGNHDDRALIGTAMGRRYQRSSRYPWLDGRATVAGSPMLLLDTSDGTVDARQIAWLQWALTDHRRAAEAGRAAPVVPIIVHHPVVTGFHAYMDAHYRLDGAERLLSAICGAACDACRPVLLAGHYHCADERVVGAGDDRCGGADVVQYVTPSLFVNTRADTAEFEPSGTPHAVRLLDLDGPRGTATSTLIVRTDG